MPSSEILELAKKIIVRDKPFFDGLLEFEKSGKIRTKSHLDLTIDKVLLARFKKYCKDNGFNMSAKIEIAIREMIKE